MRTLIALTALAAVLFAQDDSMALVKMRRDRMIAAFVQHVDGLKDVDAATRKKILAFKETGILGGEFGCIHQSLLELYPEYKRADALLMNDRLVAAAEAFGRMRTSDDPYLKTYATFRYGLSEMNRERYEDAEAPFRTVLNEMRRYAGCDVEAHFYRIICLGQDREKDEALAAIDAFEKDFPDAPERFQKAVEQIKNELLQEWESPLYDLAGRMNHAATEIGKGETGEATQKEQDEIVAIIEELIKKQEEQEGNGQGQGNGGGSGPPRGNDPSSNPANRSSLPPGASRTGDLRPTPKRKPGQQWGEMRDKEREEVLQALKEKFPDRYRELLEQYNKALAEGKRVTAPTEDE